MAHSSGKCKPCAFLFKEEGCRTGVSCQYCHLCQPGEKKRRKKERKARLLCKEGQRAQPSAAAA